jgi:hypothetical protein
MTSSPSRQTKIFVSYSHRDRRHLERLKVHLAPYLEGGDGDIEGWLWDDTRILTGARWFEDIQQALQSVDAAILLVSADFLASRFIKENELPPLLEAAQQRGVLIMPVIVGPCAFQNNKKLSQFQAANDPSRPLLNMPSTQREDGWAQVARNIYQALRALQAKLPSSTSSAASVDTTSATSSQARQSSAPPPVSNASVSPAINTTGDYNIPLSGTQERISSPVADDTFSTQVQGNVQGLVVGPNPVVNMYLNQSASPTPSVSDIPAISSEALIARYYDQLCHDPEITQLQILDMNYPLQVSDIYVKVRLNPPTRPRYEREKEQQKLHDPLTIMQQQEKWLERRAHTAIDPAVAIRQYHRCVIVGDPGAGKTTMFKRLTLLSINNELAGLPSLPVYIKLHEFARSGNDDLLDFSATTWERAYAIPKVQAARLLAERMEAGEVLFLLDALDETVIGDNMESAEESYKHVVRAIMQLTQRYHRVPIVVTARKEGYRQRGPLTGFTKLEVLDFLPEQIDLFITKWFEHYGDERRRGFAAMLITALKNQPRMTALAANPLLLSLIVLAYEDNDQQLPENRSRLYQQCVDILLHKWDAVRLIQRARPVNSDDQKQLLPLIAWHFHSQGLRSFSEAQVVPIISDFLLMRGRNTSQASGVLKAISGDDGLLRELADGMYGFLHLTLQEFFASQFVDDLSLLLTHLGDPWWEEVILLYIGQARDATSLLEHLLTPAGEGEIPEDIFASKLMLAGRCLAAHPVIRKVQLWQEIPNLLFERLRYTDYALTRQQIADALTEIGRANPERDVNVRLLALLKSEESKLSVRICVADALGDYGLRELAVDLLDFFVEKGSGLETELRESVQDAIAILADRRLLSMLQELIFDRERASLILIGLADVIANVGDENTARLLLPLLSDSQIDLYVRCAFAYSVVALSDKSTITSLIGSLADPEADEDVARSLLLALADRDYHDVIPELLALLSQQQIRPGIRVSITYVLSLVGDETVADQLSSLAADPTIDSLVRSGCIMAYTSCGLHAKQDKILSMLADSTTEKTLRLHIAMGLAEAVDQGDQALLADLRSIYVRERDGEIRFYLTIALGLLGDLSVLPQVRILFGQEGFPKHLYQRVAELLVQHTSASDLMEMLTGRTNQITLDARVALAEAIGIVGTSSLVPDLLTVLENAVVIDEVRISIAETIELLGKTRETVERLLSLWKSLQLRDPQHLSVLIDAIYQAMWAVSRGAGVIVIQKEFGYRVVERKSLESGDETRA